MFGFGEKFKKSEHKENVENAIAHFKTSLGEFKINLFVKECPETVWNFINLAEGRQETSKEGPFYDGLIFHRIIDGFMIQGGCPDSRGTGGQATVLRMSVKVTYVMTLRVFYLWPMRVQEQMVLNFFLLL